MKTLFYLMRGLYREFSEIIVNAVQILVEKGK